MRRIAALALLLALTVGPAAGAARLSVEVLESRGPISSVVARNLLQPVSLQPCARLAETAAGVRRFDVVLQIPASPTRHRMVFPSVAMDPGAVVDRELAGCVIGLLAQVRFPAVMAASNVRVRVSLGAPAPAAAGPPQLLVTGTVTDAANGSPVAGATVLFLQPWVRLGEVDPDELERQVAAVAVAGRGGQFRGALPLPRGFGYGLMVLARGFETATAAPGSIRAADGGSRLELGRIELRRKRW